MKLGELFAGYGGLGMAVEEVFNAETAWFSEIEDAPSKVLAHRWPGVPNHGDVTKIDWAAIEPVDIISGGSPCQDLSNAGKRRGMQDGTRSNLWESMREGIAIIKPKYVVWENVRGALSAGAVSEMEHRTGRVGDDGARHLRALGRVLGDLAELGYDAEWRGLRAADVGGAHSRFRVFLLASLPDAGRVGLEAGRLPRRPAQEVPEPANGQPLLPNAASERRRKGRAEPAGLEGRHDVAERRPSHDADWGRFLTAVRSWERVNGPAPRPTETNPRNGRTRLSPAFDEWLMGMPSGHITDVPELSWGDLLKLCGNVVVPQQAIAALRDMLAAFNSLDRKATA